MNLRSGKKLERVRGGVKPKFYFRKYLSTENQVVFKKPVKKFLKIRTDKKNAEWQVDLLDYKSLQFRYLLVCIDIYSRKAGVALLKSKRPPLVLAGFKRLITRFFNGNTPEVLSVDGGTEFQGEFGEYLDEMNIEKRVAKGDSSQDKKIKLSQSIVERMNLTLRTLIENYKEEEGVVHLDRDQIYLLVDGYNAHYHRGIKATPNKVYAGKETPTVVYSKNNILKVPFKVGDEVRLLLQKQQMSTGSKKKRNYSKTVYTIEEKKYNRFKLSGDGGWVPYTRLLLDKK